MVFTKGAIVVANTVASTVDLLPIEEYKVVLFIFKEKNGIITDIS
jgi:hypothetical protein